MVSEALRLTPIRYVSTRASSGVYNAGMTLIDPAQVSAWGIYDPEKNTFEKA